ncbi:ubiquitin-conjugating enzyme/RWD-like protein [Emericellopsis atlantica]|uniref:Ubiquitin-conjugating enzyme E2 Z n=1 Tax=Emericellopsis atlantica TaxID=2614577 RepID=A0A9P8CQA7_9HYPO|nr:ubiquitin-conjugating enzyme/RWD-like protein [Emericellopsis atlantica]KAG9255117.1 ubiquitin-conjugating enzyme/RWD-like protein [Emericellopsis atlantica]
MPSDQSVIRITKELSELQRSPELSIAVACRDIDVRNIRALIFGPHRTPYEFGFFEFTIKIGSEYPDKSPEVLCTTTNSGRTRFNPNIYSSGRVCLSILGTWRGNTNEQWSPAQGLESLLLSIQSLLSSNPYENEPGFENCSSEADRKAQKQYAQKIRHETLRVTVIQRLEDYLWLRPNGTKKPAATEYLDPADAAEVVPPFEPFKDLCKRRFLWYYESYLAATREGQSETKDGEAFVIMPFESSGQNAMEGKFNYGQLQNRLQNIKKALDEETASWVDEGVQSARNETTVSVNLRHQYEQVVAHMHKSKLAHHINLEGGNPFVWVITYFGPAFTNFDGGLLRIRLSLSPRFPTEQPRVKCETKLFHHLVAPDGTVCYTPNSDRLEDVRSHIDAIFSVFEGGEPIYDPRKFVNPEAVQLYWEGGEAGKKTYNRRLRRTVQQSMDDFPE